jgi:carboxyl-terminal processing protease
MELFEACFPRLIRTASSWTRKSIKILKTETEGKFGGLGIEITIKDDLLTVIAPIEDSPAWRAGIKAGDRIVKINKDLTRDMSLDDAVKKLRGRSGNTGEITILRESEDVIRDFHHP